MKRKVLISLISILTAFQSTAQVANGYYRVQNTSSTRYITMKDNAVGTVDYSSTNVDLSNIVTWRGFDYVKSNPASIIYVEQHGSQYDMKTQDDKLQNLSRSLITRCRVYYLNNIQWYARSTVRQRGE